MLVSGDYSIYTYSLWDHSIWILKNLMACMSVRTYTQYVHVRICMHCMYVGMYVCTVCMWVCMYVLYVCGYVRMHVHTFIRMVVCVCTADPVEKTMYRIIT